MTPSARASAYMASSKRRLRLHSASMEQRLSRLLDSFRSTATAATVWVIVGVPVAALIAALRVSAWVILSIPEMAATAAVLGAAQGLWLSLVGRPSKSEYGGIRWLGSVSGGLLGLLGFPPVFSRTNIVADRLLVAVAVLAAICGGIAAGFISGRVVAVPVRGRRSTLRRSVVTGCLVVVPLAALDYRFYWPPTAERLPVPRVSHQAVTNLSAGNAQGSTWAGCYEYLGKFSRGSGVIGKGGGQMRVAQTDGALKVLNGSATPLLGGVDARGRFRFGAERITGEYTLRELWEGTFKGNSLDFTQRTMVLRGTDILNTTQSTGTGRRVSCFR